MVEEPTLEPFYGHALAERCKTCHGDCTNYRQALHRRERIGSIFGRTRVVSACILPTERYHLVAWEEQARRGVGNRMTDQP